LVGLASNRVRHDVTGAKAGITRRRFAAGVAVGAAAAGAAPFLGHQSFGEAGVPAFAAVPPHRLTQSELERLRASVGAPALAAASQSGERPVSLWVSGVRMRGRSDRATIADRWHLGSITKSMTATLVACCVEAGWCDWDETIGNALEGIVPDMREEYRDATFIHLLSHRAGLQTDVRDLSVIGLPLREDDARESRSVIARQALRQQPSGPREDSFEYSHSGYVIAAVMLETRLGAPWEELMRRFVFEPLGMQSAGFGAPGREGEGAQPVGHASWFTQSITPHPPDAGISDIPTAWGPAGAVHASLSDLIRYLNAHRDNAPLLDPATWTLLHTPPFGGDYALGWYLRNDGLWHNGTNSLWYAEALIDKDSRRSSAAVCNDGRLDTVTPIVHSALMSAALPEEAEPVTAPNLLIARSGTAETPRSASTASDRSDR
jgi:CubicO group peptidase (beta-lactamase class C family)